jgi:hypothetical protein
MHFVVGMPRMIGAVGFPVPNVGLVGLLGIDPKVLSGGAHAPFEDESVFPIRADPIA